MKSTDIIKKKVFDNIQKRTNRPARQLKFLQWLQKTKNIYQCFDDDINQALSKIK